LPGLIVVQLTRPRRSGTELSPRAGRSPAILTLTVGGRILLSREVLPCRTLLRPEKTNKRRGSTRQKPYAT